MKQVEVYTDGACSGNPGPGGWGAVLRYRFDGKVYEKELSGGDASTTNNRMELTAFIEALRQLKEPCEVRLCSDSQYVINGLEKGWAKGWKRRGWKKADGSPALNPDSVGTGAGAGSSAQDHLRLGKGPRRPPGKRTLRPAGRSTKQSTWREARNMSDAFLPGNGFDTYETQDKVLVSMDGTVDCGVVVRILQQQGFGVAGAVVQLAADQSAWAAAARQAAEALGIECIVLKAEALADQPAEVLGSGNDARFAALLTAADKLGIQYVATGHHARVELGSDGVHTVCPAVDAALDESAALAALPQGTLARLLLPLGEFTAADVQEMAQDFKVNGTV